MKDPDFAAVPLLPGLDRVSLAKLTPSFERVEFKFGETVFRQGAPGDGLYIIISGTVRISL